jgi:hypothetical protein
MRDRQVGRRLWRRRKRKNAGAPADGKDAASVVTADAGDVDEGDEDVDEADDAVDEGAGGRGEAAPPQKSPGFFARLFGKKPPPPPPVVVDVAREILAIPRGAARLDAFAAKLAELVPGSAEHKRVAVAFHKELVFLATEAGVDLGLFEARVQACAQALIAANEEERAGTLFSKIGRRHQAAELFVKAGALDALEEAHAELAFEEGGQKLDARLSFERFEALTLVGLRDDALLALARAVKLWDTPAYAEVLQGFLARLPTPGRVTLQCGDEVVRVYARFPLVIGRGEEAAVRIDSPLVSRAHLELTASDDGIVAKDLVSSGGTRIDGAVMTGTTALPPSSVIDLGGVVIDVDQTPARVRLRPRGRGQATTFCARGASFVDVDVGVALVFGADVRDARVVRARVPAGVDVRVNGERPRKDLLLLVGDRIQAAGKTWTVTTGH